MLNNFLKFFIAALIIIAIKPENIFSQMFWNQACSFAGNSSSYISVRPTSSLDILGSFSIEAWLKPGNITGSSKGLVAKGGSYGAFMKYGLRINSARRIEVVTNATVRLVSRSSTALAVNQWTHVSAVYDISLAKFTIYINEFTDTSAVVINAHPVSLADSLFIGIAGQTNPYNGVMDELRIWNRALEYVEVKRNVRLTLGTGSGGYYSGLVLSMTFQKEASGGVKFTCMDWSNNQNFGTYYAVTPVDLTDQASQTIGTNQCIYLSSGDEYLAGPDDPDISPSSAVTLQAWVYPITNNDAVIIHKGPPGGGAGTNYKINIANKKLAAMISGTAFTSQDTIQPGKWTHVAFSYSYNTSIFLGSYSFFINGKRVNGGTSLGTGNVADGTDSLYIGGSIGLPDFNGYIDEVRISSHAKTEAQISDSLYVSMENASNLPGVTITYNFDGYSYCSSLRGPHLFFRNGGVFTSANSSYPVSPLNKGLMLPSFQKGFYMKTADRRIPETGDVGYMLEDSLDILLDENITDINLFTAFNHGNPQEVELFLRSPDGTVIQILNSNTLVQHADNVVTIFDDQSVNDLSNHIYASFSPSIKPYSGLSAFAGKSSRGIWKIMIHDYAGTDIGRLYSWGIQINNKTVLPKLLQCNAIIQGFYNSSSNNMIRDTLKAYLRNSAAPYVRVDSSKIYLKSDGSGSFVFNSSSVLKGIKYYLEIRHRNSIETWSNTSGITLPNLTSQTLYDFTSDIGKAYGNNLIEIDSSPIRFAIYGADVNQDGSVNLNDIIIILNDATNFLTGYIKSDVTGDNVANLTDLVLAFNNATNFVSVIKP